MKADPSGMRHGPPAEVLACNGATGGQAVQPEAEDKPAVSATPASPSKAPAQDEDENDEDEAVTTTTRRGRRPQGFRSSTATPDGSRPTAIVAAVADQSVTTPKVCKKSRHSKAQQAKRWVKAGRLS